MNTLYNRNMSFLAKKLRKDMTKEEKHLWYDFLKMLPVTVNRQKVIGRYIADFYIASSNLVIEIDGSQHYKETAKENDAERDSYMAACGIKVIRFTNSDINRRFDAVCREITKNIQI